MLLQSNYIVLNGIPLETLADRYYSEYGSFLNLCQFTEYTNPDLIVKVFSALFNQKYVITDFHGNKKWKLK